MNWNLQHLMPRNRRNRGIATAGAEANLRAALAEPAAPGEDESYRRLMGVIAEDLRLRQPAPPPRASFAWMPAASVSAAAAILIALAYTAGVDRGVRIVQDASPTQVATVPPAPEPVVPHGQYVPPAKPAPTTASVEPPAPTPALQLTSPDDAPQNYIGNIAMDGLTRDQRDLLALFVRQAQNGEWSSAARSLEHLAATDPDADMALTALQGAAEIYRTRLNDSPSALAVLLRERGTIETRLAADPADTTRTDLQRRLDTVNTSITEMEPTKD